MDQPSDFHADLAPAAAEVLDFWFGAPGSSGYLQSRDAWFRKDEAFDRLIETRFGALVAEAVAGGLQPWAQTTAGTLALILLLDQFTRNTRRGRSDAFAGDGRALTLARELVRSGADRGLAGVQRQFVYLPFEHSELLHDQTEAVRCFARLGRDEPALAGLLEWAWRHLAIVLRFGRFPHRNAALGRAGTEAEMVFLRQPGSGF